MLSLNYILDDNGEPVRCDDILAWGRWMETADRHVAEDKVGELRVSTVFLGIDHGGIADGHPVLWETMIFGAPEGHVLHGYQERYTSRVDALKGHAIAMLEAQRFVPAAQPNTED